MTLPGTTITPEYLAAWRQRIGQAEVRSQVLDRPTLRRYAAAVGSSLEVEREVPPLAHWAYFLETIATEGLGIDGHPRLGTGLYPPILLPRRMFAAASIRWLEPLLWDQPAVLTLTLADVKHRVGKSGDLVLLEVDRRLEQHGQTRVTERQTLVYRDAGGPVSAVESLPGEARPGELTWTPSPVELFRFSAVTFNAHRIHYDQDYAREVEGYPDRVVQGPLTAAKLFALAQSHAKQPILEFNFRALAPLFVNAPVTLRASDDPRGVDCVRGDGVVAMSATWKDEGGRP